MDNNSWNANVQVRRLLFEVFNTSDQEWRTRAACRGVNPEFFFPEKGGKNTSAEPKSVCKGCEVRVECLEYAIAAREPLGIWGGNSRRDREGIVRQRNASVAQLVEQGTLNPKAEGSNPSGCTVSQDRVAI